MANFASACKIPLLKIVLCSLCYSSQLKQMLHSYISVDAEEYFLLAMHRSVNFQCFAVVFYSWKALFVAIRIGTVLTTRKETWRFENRFPSLKLKFYACIFQQAFYLLHKLYIAWPGQPKNTFIQAFCSILVVKPACANAA